jgi:BNR repeat-like domain
MTRRVIGACTAVVAFAALAPGASAAVTLTRIFTDPFTNTSSQHATAVEPDTFAYGNTLVMATQSGRFFDGGATGIGWATTTNGGATWTSGVLPGITSTQGAPGAPYERVSDPTVAYDAAHGVWLVASIPILPDTSVPTVLVNRSTDGGLTWGNPVAVTSAAGNYDKDWIACDNHATSPYYGHCYTTFDDFGDGDRLKVSTSTDGGLTWGPPLNTADGASGLGGQPVVQPNGTVVIPAASGTESDIIAFRSTDGGASWSQSVTISPAITHTDPGGLRAGPLPSAEIADDGTVYAAWQDCRFRPSCESNDIVYSKSLDGLVWSPVVRVPIDGVTSGVDHFIPGLAVAGSGPTTRLGLTYYFYPDGSCGEGATPCQLEVGYTASSTAGVTWSAATTLAGPFSLDLIADTSQGRMVGDYISTSWLGDKAFSAFAVGVAPTAGSGLDEGIYVPAGGLRAAKRRAVRSVVGQRPWVRVRPGHSARRALVRTR